MTDVLAHAQSLIRCRSVTPDEGGALQYLQTVLTGAGFACERHVFSETGMPDVDNLYARIGDAAPHICFAGHTDVVPPGDESAWRFPPFGGEVHDGVLYGRGAADMKGGVAASLAAALRYLGENRGDLPGSISFLITGDEEGPSINGTKKLVDLLLARGERPDYCLLAECTSENTVGDTIKLGRRGSLSAKLTVRGTQGHVAYPQKANNPLPRLIQALNLLLLKPLDAGNDHFQPSHLEITSIDTGNPTHNLIPAAASARFNIRFNNLHSGDSLRTWIEGQLAAAFLDTGIDYAIEYEPINESFLTDPGGFVRRLKAAVQAETQQEPMLSTRGGTSDARFIKDLCPVLEIGLLNATAHKVDECTRVAGLETLTGIFSRFLHLTLDRAD